MNRVRSLASWLLLALASVVPAQLAPGLEQKIDEVFKPWDKKDAPGGVVSVSVRGKVVYAKGFGMANLENNVPVTTDTVFDVGSISKQFTATCVMLLADDGLVDIDKQASEYLPEYPVLRDQKITVRQLMAHTSGLRDYMALMAFKTGSLAFEDGDVVEVLKGQSSLNFSPGSAWDYSNTGFFFLKKIVEKVGRRSLAGFAKERIFDPLGMTHTQFLDDPTKLIPGRAFGYVDPGDGFRAGIALIAADGAGGLWTTLADMHKWTQNWKDNKLGMDPKMFAKMMVPTKLNSGTDSIYGLGFFIDDYKGVKRIQHGGDFIGFHAQVNWFPEQDVIVSTFSNDGTQNAKTLNDKVVDIMLGDVIKQDPAAAATGEITLSEAELDEYIGTYDLQGRLVDVKRVGTQLKVQVTGQPLIDVYCTEKDKFFYKIVEARIEFNRSVEGKVEALTFFQSGAVIKCPRGKPYVAPAGALDAVVGMYYSSEFDMIVKVKRQGDGLVVTSSSILDAFPLLPTAVGKFSAGPLVVDVEVKDGAVKALLVTMSRARNMRFERMSALPPG